MTTEQKALDRQVCLQQERVNVMRDMLTHKRETLISLNVEGALSDKLEEARQELRNLLKQQFNFFLENEYQEPEFPVNKGLRV